MTVIAVRDGIMAVDSHILAGGVVHGSAKKWRKVPHFPGGYVAGAGDFALVTKMMDEFISSQKIDGHDGSTLVHMRGDGTVQVFETHGWFEFDAPFYAGGSGEVIALSAMMAGASAQRAAEIACEISQTCGGDVHILKAASE